MSRRHNYFVDWSAAVASPTVSSAIITGGTTVRFCLYEIVVGFSSAPADNAIVYKAQRSTAAGTSSSYTPVPLDSADAVAISAAGTVVTGEPTYTSNKVVWHYALNQRATARWISDPDGPIVSPATSNNGVGIYPVSGSATPTADGSCYFYE